MLAAISLPTDGDTPPAYGSDHDAKIEGEYAEELKRAANGVKGSSRSVQNAFGDVANRLSEAEKASKAFNQEESAGPTYNQDIEKFCREWGGLHTVFTDLLKNTDLLAETVRQTADAFEDKFSDTSSFKASEAKAKITQYQNILEEHENHSKKASQSFSDLRSNVNVFKAEIKKWVKDANIYRLEAEIADLTREIDTLQLLINSSKKKNKTGLFTSLCCGALTCWTCLLGFICPPCWLITAGTATVTAGASVYTGYSLDELLHRQSEFKENHRILRKMVDTFELLDKIDDAVKLLEDNIVLINQELDKSAGIWADIRSKLVEIGKKIDLTQKLTDRIVLKRLETIERLLRLLSEALS